LIKASSIQPGAGVGGSPGITYGFKVNDAELTPDNLDSIVAIGEFVQRKKAGAAGPGQADPKLVKVDVPDVTRSMPASSKRILSSVMNHFWYRTFGTERCTASGQNSSICDGARFTYGELDAMATVVRTRSRVLVCDVVTGSGSICRTRWKPSLAFLEV